jgi:hypothetical protein
MLAIKPVCIILIVLSVSFQQKQTQHSHEEIKNMGQKVSVSAK